MHQSSHDQILAADELEREPDPGAETDNFVGSSGEHMLIEPTQPYEHCDGSWDQFKGDVKTFLMRMRTRTEDRVEDVQERWNRVFHRNGSRLSDQPK